MPPPGMALSFQWVHGLIIAFSWNVITQTKHPTTGHVSPCGWRCHSCGHPCYELGWSVAGAVCSSARNRPNEAVFVVFVGRDISPTCCSCTYNCCMPIINHHRTIQFCFFTMI
jgi:hypothetical protein